MKSGDSIPTMAGTNAVLPYANQHPCFGQRQGWCKNFASWRMESTHLLLHFCDQCKEGKQLDFPGMTWTKLEPKP